MNFMKPQAIKPAVKSSLPRISAGFSHWEKIAPQVNTLNLFRWNVKPYNKRWPLQVLKIRGTVKSDRTEPQNTKQVIFFPIPSVCIFERFIFLLLCMFYSAMNCNNKINK